MNRDLIVKLDTNGNKCLRLGNMGKETLKNKYTELYNVLDSNEDIEVNFSEYLLGCEKGYEEKFEFIGIQNFIPKNKGYETYIEGIKDIEIYDDTDEYEDFLNRTGKFSKLKKETKNNKNKGGNTMNNMFDNIGNSSMGVFKNVGRRFDGVFGIALTTGETAINLGNDMWVSFNKETKEITDLSGLALDMNFMPSITMPVSKEDVSVGDVILDKEELYIVYTKNKNTYKLINYTGDIVEKATIHNLIMGKSYVIKVVNMMEGKNLFNNTELTDGDTTNPMSDIMSNPIVMASLLSGDSETGKGTDDMFKKMMMMQLFQGQNNFGKKDTK